MSKSITYARHLVKGSAIVFTAGIATGILGLLLRMFLARSLSVAEYGLFYAIFVFVSFFGLFRGLGFDDALRKYIPEFLVKKRFDNIKSSITFALLLRAIISFIIASVLLVFFNQIVLVVFGTATAVLPFLILLIWFILMSFFFLTTLFVPFKNVPAYAAIELFDSLCVFLLALLLVGSLGLGIAGAAAAYLFTALATVMLSFVVLKRKYPQVFKVKAPVTKPLLIKLSKFALPVFLVGIIGSVIGYMDTIMIAVFRTLPEVGLYQVAQPLGTLLFSVAGAFMTVFFPMVSELWAKREKKLLGNMMHFLTKFSFVLITPAALIFIAFPDVIIRIFFGPAYLAGTTALQIWSIVAIFHVLTALLQYSLAGIGRPIINTKVVALMAGFNFVGNLLLIPQFGIEGASVATLGAYLLGFILLFYYAKKFVGFTTPASTLIKTAIGGALTLFFIFGLKSILVLPAISELFIVGILSIAFYGMWILATKAVTKDDLRLIARVIPILKWLVKITSKFT